MHIGMNSVSYGELTDEVSGEASRDVRARVNAARRIQQQRYAGTGLYANAALPAEQLNTHCALDDACGKLMKQAYQTLGLSPRGMARVRKVARTIADLGGADSIGVKHLAEALQYRTPDGRYWG
jgi:magnesium chelatase family protein